MKKGNTFYKQFIFHIVFFYLVLLLSSNALAQEPNDDAKNNTYMVTLHAHGVIDNQLLGYASDPVQAVHNLALKISHRYGGTVVHEVVSEQYGFILSGISREQVTQIADDARVQSINALSGSTVQQRSALSVSVSCSYTGLATLYQCTATASGGTPSYTYAWQGANSTPSGFGNIAFIDSCAGFTSESFRVTVTDSTGQQASRIGSVPCTRGGL